jgi:uncharacterized BrkB/YihY/UPF0761 family membrane protein
MEALRTLWSFLLLFCLLGFTQLFGVLLFFRLKVYKHALAHLGGFVAPVFLSIVFSWMMFIYRYYQAHPRDRCGGQLLGAFFIIILMGSAQVVIGSVVQTTLHNKCKNRYGTNRSCLTRRRTGP